MRIKNKEIRRRRHRKEQVIKAAEREMRAKYSGKTAGAAPEKAATKAKAAPKKAESAEKPKKAAKAKEVVEAPAAEASEA